MYVKRNTETRARNKCIRGNAISITYICVCVCARAHVCGWVCACRSAGLCLRACSLTYPTCYTPPYWHLRPLWLHHTFRHYLIHGTIFRKTLLNIICVLIFSTTFIWILRIIQRDTVINVKSLHVNYPLSLLNINKNWILSTDLRKKV